MTISIQGIHSLCRERISKTGNAETYCMLPLGHPKEEKHSAFPSSVIVIKKVPCGCIDCMRAEKTGQVRPHEK